MKITGAWLAAAGTQALLCALSSAGYQALLVGGCVRNAIIGVPVSDIDIATDAVPDAVIQIATNAGFKVVATGLDHGTVTVIADGIPHEVTTLRRDVQTNGRRAVVAYLTDIKEDAERRDFTINALYAQSDGTVVDPLAVLPDLLARRVRFVGDPAERIREDYLRILRFFRFFAIYADPANGLDADGLASCAAGSGGLDTLSRERIGAEMRKILSAFDPAPALAAMDTAGILARVLPGASSRAMSFLVHLEDGTPRGWMCRLAVVGGANITQNLRLNRQEAARLAVLRTEIESTASPDALGWRHGVDLTGDVLYAKAAVFEAPLPPHWHEAAARGAGAEFPISSSDLMPQLQGKALGTKLKHLQERWLTSGMTLTREQLLA